MEHEREHAFERGVADRDIGAASPDSGKTDH
jgi:hypothetical protein